MRNKIRYVLTGLLTFALGVLISPIHFKLNSIACGRGSTYTYTSSHFVELTATASPFDSEVETSAAFQKMVNESTLVLEQNEIFDHNGVKTGSRAVLLLNDDDGRQRYGIVSTNK